MPTRRPDPARERLWRKRLARWKASGLKVREFCDREGVTPTAFAHWRKELAARDARRAATDEPDFVPVRITTPAAAAPLDVALPSGPAVRVPPGFDPAHLRAVVAALEGRSC
jgi:transposase